MKPRRIGLALYAVGVIGLLAGMFGIGDDGSLVVGAIGALLLIIGAGLFVFTLRDAKRHWPPASVLFVVAAAIVMHAWQAFAAPPDGPSPGFFLWSSMPYFVCLVAAAVSTSAIPALAGATIALCLDALAHYSAFISPSSSTSSLALLFVPLWNTLLFTPLAMAIAGWMISRGGLAIRERLSAARPGFTLARTRGRNASKVSSSRRFPSRTTTVVQPDPGTIRRETMKNNPVGWFEIYVQDMERAKKFYEAVLQGELEQLPAPDIEMWAFPMEMNGSGAGGALVKMAGFGSGGNSTLVYFVCDDCAVEEGRVQASGGRVQKPKMSIGQYGFISLAVDTEGNMFGLHSMK